MSGQNKSESTADSSDLLSDTGVYEAIYTLQCNTIMNSGSAVFS
jgi:hypothetical protein